MLKADENVVIIDEPIKILKKRSYKQRAAKIRQISYDEDKDDEEEDTNDEEEEDATCS